MRLNYEHKRQQLAPRSIYIRRIFNSLLWGIFLLTGWLGLGILGYHATVPEFDWYDSLLNASMIMSGMGPVIDQNIHLTEQAKVFASIYAIISGIIFISAFAILITPVVHRFFHRLHLENNKNEQ